MGHYDSDYEYEYRKNQEAKQKYEKERLAKVVKDLKPTDYTLAYQLLKNIKHFHGLSKMLKDIHDDDA